MEVTGGFSEAVRSKDIIKMRAILNEERSGKISYCVYMCDSIMFLWDRGVYM
jgi:hypothetical protein